MKEKLFNVLPVTATCDMHMLKMSDVIVMSSIYRGLLLPKIVVDDFGGTRTDPGMLGAGIYFAGSSRFAL